MIRDPEDGRSTSIESKLSRYSALAGAVTVAGAAAPAADAAIVHVTGSPVMVGLNDNNIPWNIDGVGGEEFNFSQFFTTSLYPVSTFTSCVEYSTEGACTLYSTSTLLSTYTLNFLSFIGSQYGGILQDTSDNSVVSTGDLFQTAGTVTYFSGALFPFVDGPQTIGFEFGNPPLVGWANIVVGPNSLEITEWAYETTSGLAIGKGDVPEPSSLALLAAGAAGFGLYRRRRQRS